MKKVKKKPFVLLDKLKLSANLRERFTKLNSDNSKNKEIEEPIHGPSPKFNIHKLFTEQFAGPSPKSNIHKLFL